MTRFENIDSNNSNMNIISRLSKLLVCLLFAITIFGGVQGLAQDQDQENEYYRAKVNAEQIVDSSERNDVVFAGENQLLFVELLNGPDKGEEFEVISNVRVRTGDSNLIRTGETILLLKNPVGEGPDYFFYSRYRLNYVFLWIGLFLLLVIGFARKQGFMSMLGLVAGVLVIFFYMLPQIAGGASVFLTVLIGVIITAFISLYLAHGFNQRTTLALGSTLITLGFAVFCAWAAVTMVGLSGAGTEEAFYLPYNEELKDINLQGLFLGGVLIGTLGVLDDITTAQTAVVAELKRANNALNAKELYKRSLTVGTEHIASLVNTLAFAYIGASFPLFLSYIYATNVPWWVLLNSDQIIEEIVQTLVGSSALVVAVPISSYIAAKWFASNPPKDTGRLHVHNHGHAHHH